MYTFLAYIHLSVSRIHVERCEVLCFTKCIDKLIHSGQRIRIIDVHRVTLPVIDTEAKFAVRIWYKEYRGGPL